LVWGGGLLEQIQKFFSMDLCKIIFSNSTYSVKNHAITNGIPE
jgi:hypothetical protein